MESVRLEKRRKWSDDLTRERRNEFPLVRG